MSKELCLKKAYNAATVNGVVRSADSNVSAAVIKLGMVEYAKKNGIEISDSEITEYMNAKHCELKNAIADFTIQTKMMN